MSSRFPLVTPANRFLPCIAILVGFLSCVQVHGQSGLRQTLELMDKNENGSIDPGEVTPLARPYLERITAARRLSLERPNEIEQLQEAARIYYALQNGITDKLVPITGESTVKSFLPDRDEPLVPEFGLAKIKYPYTQDDLDHADRTLRNHDRDRDGTLDREEAKDGSWSHRSPFEVDMNQDGRLTRLELAQRYARRRLLGRMTDELVKKARRTGDMTHRDSRHGDRGRESERWWQREGTESRLTVGVLSRFDTNENGRLEPAESLTLGMPIGQIDVNRDGELTRKELQDYLLRLQGEIGDPTSGIPGWFFELDQNRDDQVSMAEFTQEWTSEKVKEFTLIDANGDGLLIASEVIRSKMLVGGSYTNRNAETLPPFRTTISEIEVTDDYPIGDLNVQLSITHSCTSHLDAFLIGPDDQRIELFTAVGGNDDNFAETIFDDQSRTPINKARPPFKGSFIPEGLLKQQPSLSHFKGKSTKGVWQLVIHSTRSDRFGLLHHWSLLVKPLDDMLSEPAVEPKKEGRAERRRSLSGTDHAEIRQRFL